MKPIFLLCLVLIAGCLQPSAESDSGAEHLTFAPVPFDSADGGAVLPAVSQVQETPQVKAYTGAIVYGDPSTCEACRYLDADLFWLAENYGWSVGARGSPVYTGTEDWIFSLPEARHDRTPTVEYVVDGHVSEVLTGYSTDDSLDQRKLALKNIVSRHPAAAD